MRIESRELYDRDARNKEEEEIFLPILRQIFKHEEFDFHNRQADEKEGGDAINLKTGENIACRWLALEDGKFEPEWADYITITTKRDYQDGGDPEDTEIKKWKNGSFQRGVFVWRRRDEAPCMVVVYQITPLLQKAMLLYLSKMTEISNNFGPGGGVCGFKKGPIALIYACGSLRQVSQGHLTVAGLDQPIPDANKLELLPVPPVIGLTTMFEKALRQIEVANDKEGINKIEERYLSERGLLSLRPHTTWQKLGDEAIQVAMQVIRFAIGDRVNLIAFRQMDAERVKKLEKSH